MAIGVVDLPEPIRLKIAELEQAIDFETIVSKGGNGHVAIGLNRLLQRRVVYKFYYWGDGAHVEPKRLAQLASDHILPVHDAAPLNEEDAYFVTPYCSNGDLEDALVTARFGPLQAIDVALQAAAGASYIHGEGFLHRDLKPSNIFCTDDGKFVIGDFGSIVPIQDEGYGAALTKHSLIYRPPEDFDGNRYYRQGDVYQIGMLLYELCGGVLHKNERDWLKPTQQLRYDGLAGYDQQAYATEIIQNKIKRGQIFSWDAIPAWVSQRLLSVIRRAVASSMDRRFATVADLVAGLNNVRRQIYDWRILDGTPCLAVQNKAYRIVEVQGGFRIEKRLSGNWRTERRLHPQTMREAVQLVEHA
ncbi:protein kinase [Devosia sp.]|uniref:protein kinase domain-containing protein n=1 Tax=Devosia sp. TaxID=1871048 RepID=UPI001B015B7F|nr:protein kinase [Devosia sp.]MBO9589456.1 protein kinase [Devosia sp.]